MFSVIYSFNFIKTTLQPPILIFHGTCLKTRSFLHHLAFIFLSLWRYHAAPFNSSNYYNFHCTCTPAHIFYGERSHPLSWVFVQETIFLGFIVYRVGFSCLSGTDALATSFTEKGKNWSTFNLSMHEVNASLPIVLVYQIGWSIWVLVLQNGVVIFIIISKTCRRFLLSDQ